MPQAARRVRSANPPPSDMATFIDYNNELHREKALMAIVASPDLDSAKEFLQGECDLLSTPRKLEWIRDNYRDQYNELRERVAPILEKSLTHNLLDNALFASEIEREAMGQLRERISEGRVATQYLSRVVRDLADAQSKAVEKKLSLEGRPTVITENRGPDEILKALEAKGIVLQIGAGDD